MPGVPSGRGCDGCRKQKKKCDQQKPACSRCSRLEIPCVGAGQKRYKFKDQSAVILRKAQSRSPPDTPSESSMSTVFEIITRVPYNETNSVADAFISRLEVKDMRYDITCYGTFLDKVPQRLGRSKALDASVKALTTCFTFLHTTEDSVKGLESYVNALRVLRKSLADPATATSPDTLCAIYFIMIIQGWMGTKDCPQASHGEGIAHILKAGISQKWTEPFEVEMLVTLCIPVIIESIANPKIKLNTWFWRLLENYRPEKTQGCEEPYSSQRQLLSSLRLSKLAQLPDYFQEPEPRLAEIREHYNAMLVDSKTLLGMLSAMEAIPAASTPGPEARNHRNFQTSYGVVVALILLLNTILRVYYPEDGKLAEEAVIMTSDILALAQEAGKYRPLGAGYIPMCLATAWASMEDDRLRTVLELLVLDYSGDFQRANWNWMTTAYWMKSRYDAMRLSRVVSQQRQVYVEPAVLALEPKVAPEPQGDLCCVM